VFSNIGGPKSGIGSAGLGNPNETEFTIQLKTLEERNNQPTEQFMKDLRVALQNKYPEPNYSMAALGLVPRAAPIEITLSGSNLTKVMDAAKSLKNGMELLPGADNVQLSVKEGSPEYKIIPNQDKMQRLGLITAYVGMAIRTAITGNDDATMTEDGTEYPIRIWYDNADRKNYESLKNITIVNPKGMPIKLSQIADIVKGKSASLLERKDRQPSVTLTAEALGVPSGTVANEVLAYIKENPLPEGIDTTWGSDIAKQNDSFGALGSVLLISFILIYLI
jgi:HAE1 family hydrophobic/amphiphilic exporter-1